MEAILAVLFTYLVFRPDTEADEPRNRFRQSSRNGLTVEKAAALRIFTAVLPTPSGKRQCRK